MMPGENMHSDPHKPMHNSRSQEQKEKYQDLQQERLDHQKHLSGLNDNVRQGLHNLEKKVEQLAHGQEPGIEEGGVSTCVAPSNDATVGAALDGGGEATIREELRALRRKVNIIAANVLGEAEDDSTGIGPKDPSPEEKELLHSNQGENKEADVETAKDVASIDVAENNIESTSSVADDEEGGAMVEKNLEQEQESTVSVSPRLVSQRLKARTNWAKIRMNRAILVKKIRRQVRSRFRDLGASPRTSRNYRPSSPAGFICLYASRQPLSQKITRGYVCPS